MEADIVSFRTSLTLLLLLAISIELSAQQQARYKLVDLGTLGGPSAYKSVNAPGYQILSDASVVSFSADTSIPDPLCGNPDCFVSHATRWKKGVLTDMGALSVQINISASGAINARGWIAGQSENGEIDPATGFPETRSAFWKDDPVPINLGTFGGNWSLATTLNDKGQVVGFATNTIPDPASMFLGGTQTRAFLWENGVLTDLGTLGGPDAQALSINQRGQVAGISYTDPNEVINPTTGVPTVHAYVWDHGSMHDLGTLGGTYVAPFGTDGAEGSVLVNNRGQIIGLSTLPGDGVYHPFLWDHGIMTDLGTLGGDNGTAIWLTDTGEVVGEADLPTGPPGCVSLGCIHHAFLWRAGVMTDLGTLGADQCSRALMMNSRGQVVGTSIGVCGTQSTHAFLWENGGPMVDLNTLISQDSGATLYEADNINERGEIVASGLPAGCNDRFACGHVYLLIPCDDGAACANDNVSTSATLEHYPPLKTVTPGRLQPESTRLDPLTAFRLRMARRYQVRGVRPLDH